MKKKKGLYLITIVLVVTIIVVGLIKNIGKNNKGLEASNTDLGIPTEIQEVKSSELIEKISYVGTVESEDSVILSPKITSEVDELVFKEGDIVKKGDIIARLDDSQFVVKLNTALQKIETLETNYAYLNREVETYYEGNPSVKKVETAKENFNYLKNEAEKYKTLYEYGAIPQNSYDKIKHERDTVQKQLEELNAASENTYNKLVHEENMTSMQLKELYAMVEELNVSLEDTMIHAPIDGRIRMIDYSLGDLAMAGRPFVIIDGIESHVIKVQVGEQDLAKINIGTKAIVSITGQDNSIEAEVTNIMPNVNPVTRIGEVEVSFTVKDNRDMMIGTSVQVEFVINETEQGLVIETAFIKDLEDSQIVYVLENGHVYEREIKTGLVVENKAQVLEGLHEGEKIACKNLTKLYEGAKVYVFQGADKK